MEIRINTSEADTNELTAMIALCASLGGRLPASNEQYVQVSHSGDYPVEELIAAMPVPTVNISTGNPEMSIGPDGLGERQPDVDSKGTPWDARIHSESRATVADGSWRKRRGVSDETFAEVMAELTDAAPPPSPADEQDEEVPLAPEADEPVPPPPAPTEDAPSAPEPAASAPVAGSFADFGAFVAAVSKHGKTYAELNEMAALVGVPMFKDMKDHADKWDMFFSMIG